MTYDQAMEMYFPNRSNGSFAGSSALTVSNPLEGPANIDTSYQFGDWITGRSAQKQSQANQAEMDYAEWVRNQASAKEQRQWEEYMSNTQVQRSMADLKAAGLNPWLALQNGVNGASVPNSSKANVTSGKSSQYKRSENQKSSGVRDLSLLLFALARLAAV